MRSERAARRTRAHVALFVVMVVIAAACGGTTDAAESDSAPRPPESTSSLASTEPEPGTSVDPFAASWTGVTAETIRIGVVWSDLDELRELGLVDINYGDIPLVWQTLIDEINAQGGVLGRNLEMVFDQYNPVDSSSVDEMCGRLTEDNEVFAVVGSLAGPALEGVLCIIETQETIMVGGTHRPDLLDRARAPWISTEWNQERRFRALLDLYEDQGLLEGRLALLDDHREHNGLTTDTVLPALDALGKELALELTGTAEGADELALESQIAVFAELLRSDGVETLLIVQSAIALGLPLIREAGFEGTILTIDGGSYLAGLGGFDERDPSIYAGAYGPTAFGSEQVWAMESTQRCVDTFTNANPDIEVMPSDQVPDGDPAWASVLLPACRFLDLFTMAAEAAGPDLTPTTFEQAAHQLGSFELPGQPFNSIAPGKLDADDGMGLGVFDPSLGTVGGLAEIVPYASATTE